MSIPPASFFFVYSILNHRRTNFPLSFFLSFLLATTSALLFDKTPNPCQALHSFDEILVR